MLVQQLPVNQLVGLRPPLPPFPSPYPIIGKPAVSGVVVIATLALIRAQLLVLMEVATVDYSVIHILEQVFLRPPLPNLH
jgi:hypothetical protein